jgi:hypothetical protein
MRRTNIYLDDGQTDALDRLAREEGVSRAELIRRMLDAALTGDDDSIAADLMAFDESFGSLREAELPDRADGERAQHLAHMWRKTA